MLTTESGTSVVNLLGQIKESWSTWGRVPSPALQHTPIGIQARLETTV